MRRGRWAINKRSRVAHFFRRHADLPEVYSWAACVFRRVWWMAANTELRPARKSDKRCARCLSAERKAR